MFNVTQGFDVVYVAENHENLHHILVFFNITPGMPNAEVRAEVMPPLLNLPMDGGDHLLIKSGPHSSLPLMLPAHTTSGRQKVRVQHGHYEIKLITTQSSPPTDFNKTVATTTESSGLLLDSSHLLHLKPTTFVCSSCTLPVVQSSKVDSYRDLPSEHWEELVEAWMCHGDQKLNDHVAKHNKQGLWPSTGQGLVGGSYILFEEGVMNTSNLHIDSYKKVCCSIPLFACLLGYFKFLDEKEDWRWQHFPPTVVSLDMEMTLWCSLSLLLQSRLPSRFCSNMIWAISLRSKIASDQQYQLIHHVLQRFRATFQTTPMVTGQRCGGYI